MQPLYTARNCSFSCPLQWGLSVFWRDAAEGEDWFTDLAETLEGDGIRLLGHRFLRPDVSQFTISTKPHVAPEVIIQRVKGRLQHLVRDRHPRALKRNYALRSLGKVTRATVEDYVASQLEHHRLADPRTQRRFEKYQIRNPRIDLSRPRRTSHGVYWYNLHLVLVQDERWRESREQILRSTRDMIVKCCKAKDFLLSRAGLLPDHLHLILGCPISVSPLDVALCFLNNLAYAQGMRRVFQFGGFVGTVGEYSIRAVKEHRPTGTTPHGDKPRGGG